MKRMLHSGVLLLVFSLYAGMLQAQLEEDFTPQPANWIKANGYSYHTVNGNDVLISSNGNSDPVIGTPIVKKSGSTVNFCFDIFGYTSQDGLGALPCDATVDLYFVDPSVNNSNDLSTPANIFGVVTGLPVAGAGGKVCNSFTFPAAVTATEFRVFVAINPGCNMGSTRFAFDNFVITGLSEVCTGSNCPPVALPDIFGVGLLPTTVVLYGNNPDYLTVPGAQVYAPGIDNDPNDAQAQLTWTLESGPSIAGILVVVNPDGTAVITRTDPNVSGIATFVYKLTDADLNSDTALVTLILGAGAPLPVELVSFTGNRNGTAVGLKWTTASESGSAGFEIQRMINNEFKTIGYVASKASNGTSNSPISYQFGETFASNNVAWYRLVQINTDGTKKVLPSLAVRGLDELKKMLIYPNPGSTINVLFGSSSIRDISISDLSGKLVKRWNSYRDDNLTVNGLQTGMYMLMVIDKNTSGKTISKILINNR